MSSRIPLRKEENPVEWGGHFLRRLHLKFCHPRRWRLPPAPPLSSRSSKSALEVSLFHLPSHPPHRLPKQSFDMTNCNIFNAIEWKCGEYAKAPFLSFHLELRAFHIGISPISGLFDKCYLYVEESRLDFFYLMNFVGFFWISYRRLWRFVSCYFYGTYTFLIWKNIRINHRCIKYKQDVFYM